MTLSWQEEVRRRLRERRERAAKEPPKVSPPPRYDDVYFEGLTQLNVKANKQANKPSILDILKEAELSWRQKPWTQGELQKELERERAISDFWRAEALRLRGDCKEVDDRWEGWAGSLMGGEAPNMVWWHGRMK